MKYLHAELLANHRAESRHNSQARNLTRERMDIYDLVAKFINCRCYRCRVKPHVQMPRANPVQEHFNNETVSQSSISKTNVEC